MYWIVGYLKIGDEELYHYNYFHLDHRVINNKPDWTLLIHTKTYITKQDFEDWYQNNKSL